MRNKIIALILFAAAPLGAIEKSTSTATTHEMHSFQPSKIIVPVDNGGPRLDAIRLDQCVKCGVLRTPERYEKPPVRIQRERP